MFQTKKINGHEYYSLNYIFELWKNGKYVKKQLAQFALLDSTKNAIEYYTDKYGCQSFIAYRGSGENSGSWACKEIAILFYNWLYKLPKTSYTRDELIFCETIQMAFHDILSFECQYCFMPYIVDMYCEQLNLVIEYDEKHHKLTIEKDNRREEYLKNEYNLIVIRANQNENIGIVINKIMKLVQAAEVII